MATMCLPGCSMITQLYDPLGGPLCRGQVLLCARLYNTAHGVYMGAKFGNNGDIRMVFTDDDQCDAEHYFWTRSSVPMKKLHRLPSRGRVSPWVALQDCLGLVAGVARRCRCGNRPGEQRYKLYNHMEKAVAGLAGIDLENSDANASMAISGLRFLVSTASLSNCGVVGKLSRSVQAHADCIVPCSESGGVCGEPSGSSNGSSDQR